jgi:hypothetical protein
MVVEVEDGAKIDEQDSASLANEILGTGGDTQVQEDQPGEKPPAQPGEEVPPEEAAPEQEEPEVGEDGKPIPKEPEPGEAQDSAVLNEAVERLNKVAGRKLSNEESVEAMATSYMKADAKIQSLSEQLQEAVVYRQKFEALVGDPIISQILEGKNPFETSTVQTEGLDEDVSPAVQKIIAQQNQQIQALTQKFQKLNSGVETGEQMKVNQQVNQARGVIDEFAAKPENADFKEVLTEFREMQKLNPYIKMPEILKKLGAMMDNGVSIEEGWGVLNPHKVESRLKGKIAAAQKKKLAKGGIAVKSKGKSPGIKDLSNAPLMSTEDLMKNVVANANARAVGEE